MTVPHFGNTLNWRRTHADTYPKGLGGSANDTVVAVNGEAFKMGEHI